MLHHVEMASSDHASSDNVAQIPLSCIDGESVSRGETPPEPAAPSTPAINEATRAEAAATAALPATTDELLRAAMSEGDMVTAKLLIARAAHDIAFASVCPVTLTPAPAAAGNSSAMSSNNSGTLGPACVTLENTARGEVDWGTITERTATPRYTPSSFGRRNGGGLGVQASVAVRLDNSVPLRLNYYLWPQGAESLDVQLDAKVSLVQLQLI